MASPLRSGSMSAGMPGGERPVRTAGRAAVADLSKSRPKPKLGKVMPEVWKLVKPRAGILALGFVLMVINRITGLVMPFSIRFLIDGVMHNHNMSLLPKIVAGVVGATIIQGVTSYSLTQLLSKAGQRLITEMREQVQAHIGLLSIKFFDENRTGALVARIMSDVEGVRNLVGTGLVDFIGGLLTATFAFVYLLTMSKEMTLLTFCILVIFALILRQAFKTIRPIFRERSKINAEVTGRLTESLGGVRVVKGYHAEESEARVFAAGAKRLLDNVISSLSAQSFLALLSTTVLGAVGAMIMYLGARQVVSGRLTTGDYVSYVAFLAFMVAPISGLSGHRNAVDRSAGGAGSNDGDPERAGGGRRPAAHGDARRH